jgi:hypothetical protein
MIQWAWRIGSPVVLLLRKVPMGETSIEWTDATWNPVAGCTIVSPGCNNCYAMRMTVAVLGVVTLARMHRFGKHYAREVFVQYLAL